MRLAIIAATLIGLAAPALAQSYQVSPSNGSGFIVQGSDGSVYQYSVAPNGSYIVQKQGASGHYQAGAPSANGYGVFGVDSPNWTMPVVIPPQTKP